MTLICLWLILEKMEHTAESTQTVSTYQLFMLRTSADEGNFTAANLNLRQILFILDFVCKNLLPESDKPTVSHNDDDFHWRLEGVCSCGSDTWMTASRKHQAPKIITDGKEQRTKHSIQQVK